VVGGSTSGTTYTMTTAKKLSIPIPTNSGPARDVLIVNTYNSNETIGTMRQAGIQVGVLYASLSAPSGYKSQQPLASDGLVWYTDLTLTTRCTGTVYTMWSNTDGIRYLYYTFSNGTCTGSGYTDIRGSVLTYVSL
jgi:hypothetical protein